MDRPYRNKEWLEQKYIVEGLSTKDIAKLGNCNPWTVGHWLKKHGISLRSRRVEISVVCEFCGKGFHVRPSRAKKAKFCSKSCAAKGSKRRPSEKVTLVCESCGKEFEVSLSRVKGRKFCSRGCYAVWQKEHPANMSEISKASGLRLIVCEWCEEVVKVVPSRKDARFCSNECYTKWRCGRPRPSTRTGKVISCEVCGKEFYINAWQVKNAERRFCSKECRGKWHSKTFVKERAAAWRGGISEQVKQCEICDREFITLDSRRAEGYGRFCSRECCNEYLVGENAPNWHGGKSFEPYPASFNRRFKQLIKERDGYTCAVCGVSGEDVHHINYVKADTNPGNCITLCKGCHGRTTVNRDYWPGFLKGLMFEQVMLASLAI